MLTDWSAFATVLRRGLQTSGQTLFHIRYEDINDIDILNGLAAFLGSAHRLPEASRAAETAEPRRRRGQGRERTEMVAALARIDRFGLDRVPTARCRVRPGFQASWHIPRRGCLFLPVAGRRSTRVLLTGWRGSGMWGARRC
jgi:hypothetical protein